MEECPHELAIEISETYRARESELMTVFDDLVPENAQILTSRTERGREISEQLGCTVCDGLIIDLSSGKLYCGQDVPQDVLDSNLRILEN